MTKFYIKVIKSTSPTAWYAKCIGKNLEVTYDPKEGFMRWKVLPQLLFKDEDLVIISKEVAINDLIETEQQLSILQNTEKKEAVNHPSHYGGADNPYEAIKVIENWNLNFNLGNTVKYISRAGKKEDKLLQDLKKALWYLEREIKNIENESI